MTGGPLDENGLGACWVFRSQPATLTVVRSLSQKLVGQGYQTNDGKVYQGKSHWFWLRSNDTGRCSSSATT